jgi:hypothetical protein
MIRIFVYFSCIFGVFENKIILYVNNDRQTDRKKYYADASKFILQSRQSANTFLEPFPSQKPEATNKCTCYVGPSANEIRRCCIVSFPWSDKSAYLVGFPGKGVQNYTNLCPLCFFPDSENG